jgi:uncharacterized protein YjbI with pentapeptide repeats
MLGLTGTSVKNVIFKNCKVLGIAFHTCTDFLFEVNFENCMLDFTSFAHKKMPKTRFINCSLKETSFAGTVLKQAVFDQCDLERAVFNDADLSGCDFTTASNYQINPENTILKKARFGLQGIPGLLAQYDIKII